MSSLLFGISLSALLSTTSLLIVLFRVSPLTAPLQAVPTLFCSLFLSVSSVSALLLYLFWRTVPLHTWDVGKLLGISVRQGLFLGSACTLLLLFQLLGALTWWAGLLIFLMFGLVELGLNA